MKKIRVSVPGRVCLFGEHQDYLKLPVITAAIDLRMNVTGEKSESNQIIIHLPDINSSEIFPILNSKESYKYQQERDYFKSVINVLKQENVQLVTGCECTVQSTIPINSKTSSSSALNVAWCRFIMELSNVSNQSIIESRNIARIAYLAEVEEFGEPGGMMDHYATAMGGLLYQEFQENVSLQHLRSELGTFVLGDSLEAKDTTRILKRVKQKVLAAIDEIKITNSDFNLESFPCREVESLGALITQEQMEVLEGALINRDITIQARELFDSSDFNHREFGRLLNYHQEILDKKLKISTFKINKMLSAAIANGAYGGKINGSGGGGCMFVYAPENPEGIAKSISEVGGVSYIVKVDSGLKFETLKE